MVIIRSQAGKHGFVFQQRAEVVDRAAHEKQAAVQRLVGNVLSGVFEIFVGIFYVPQDWQIEFEVSVVDGNKLVVKFLGAIVRGANRKPVADVWQQCRVNRLPEIDALSLGICSYNA